jgi:hypothetical protein
MVQRRGSTLPFGNREHRASLKMATVTRHFYGSGKCRYLLRDSLHTKTIRKTIRYR